MGINHVHLHVRDAARAAAFHRGALGAEEAFRVGDELIFLKLADPDGNVFEL